MAADRSHRARKQVDYSKFAAGDEEDDDFDCTPPVSKKAKKEPAKKKSSSSKSRSKRIDISSDEEDEFVQKKPTTSRRSITKRQGPEDKAFELELELALEMSKHETSTSQNTESSGPPVLEISTENCRIIGECHEIEALPGLLSPCKDLPPELEAMESKPVVAEGNKENAEQTVDIETSNRPAPTIEPSFELDERYAQPSTSGLNRRRPAAKRKREERWSDKESDFSESEEYDDPDSSSESDFDPDEDDSDFDGGGSEKLKKAKVTKTQPKAKHETKAKATKAPVEKEKTGSTTKPAQTKNCKSVEKALAINVDKQSINKTSGNSSTAETNKKSAVASASLAKPFSPVPQKEKDSLVPTMAKSAKTISASAPSRSPLASLQFKSPRPGAVPVKSPAGGSGLIKSPAGGSGLRLGLSRNSRGIKPLHANVKVPH